MSKIAVTRQNKIARTGSYATRLSATGRDTLGYGANFNVEALTQAEQREILKQRVDELTRQRRAIKPRPNLPRGRWLVEQARYDALGLEIQHVILQLRDINATLKHRDSASVGEALYALFQQRFPESEWEMILDQAHARQKQLLKNRTRRNTLLAKRDIVEDRIRQIKNPSWVLGGKAHENAVEYRERCAEITDINAELAAMKGLPSYERSMEGTVLDIIREQMTPEQWAVYVKEARSQDMCSTQSSSNESTTKEQARVRMKCR